jgi:hypothetical protein
MDMTRYRLTLIGRPRGLGLKARSRAALVSFSLGPD